MIHATNIKTGLIGEKLSHSFSPQIHSYLADYEYKLYEIPEDQVENFVKNSDVDAFNVTIPYKKTVMQYLDYISPEATRIGAVNTVVRKGGKLYGYNTDYFGIVYTVNKSGVDIKNKKVLILGSGGASVTAQTAMRDLGAGEVITISRRGENNYENISKHKDADIIINTTPVGMYPNNGISPVDLTIFTSLQWVFDMIFNPKRTRLLFQAEQLGIRVANGLLMLVAQAKKACEFFLNTKIDDSEIEYIEERIAVNSQNIVLVGMPGCGKTTVGKRVAELLGRDFVDLDHEIEVFAGEKIPVLFEKYGEEGFRVIEQQVVSEIGKKSWLVISTGGGVVTREENYYPLYQNGQIIYMQRDIKDLCCEGRPLSKKGALEEMYNRRYPLYMKFSSAIAQGTNDVDISANNVIKAAKL
ncbi:MAG: shikimate kinase [Clostridia bacterium]|nr:shikimate kinase [Clostridia bacterium]